VLDRKNNMKKKHSVCVVTVTYGERTHLLRQVLESCLQDERIKKIIVVDNASNLMDAFFNNYDRERIKRIRLEENTGSAGGYYVGIEDAYKNNECQYIWLLDDDNCPTPKSLEALLTFIDNQLGLVVVQSLRPNYMPHKRLFSTKQPNRLFSTNNSFLGFNLNKFFYKVAFVFSGRKTNLNTTPSGLYNLEVPYTQYGGLLIDRSIIKSIGYPRKDFYLYSDDGEFTLRMSKAGFRIFIVRASIIDDIDRSWNNTEDGNRIIAFPMLQMGSDQRVYYSVRNRVRFDFDYFKTNVFIYQINKITYLTLLFIMSIFLRRVRRFNLIIKAVRDGSSGNLGEIHL